VARRSVDFSPEAELEAHEAFVWYWQRNREVGERFEAELIEVLDRIAEAPEQGPEVERGVRRLLLHRFPYAVLYAIEPKRVLVLTVMHTRRRPGTWRGRG
jgi:plasmid stabilization system protein ParE